MENSSLRSPEGADSRLELLLGRDALDALAARRVLLVGVGGVGSWCAEALVRSGVRRIALMDDDVVAPSNLNRQLHATVPALGTRKPAAMARRLREVVPECETEEIDAFFGADSPLRLADYDLVVDAIDTLRSKTELALRAAREGVPFVSSMGAARKLDPTQVRVASIWKTDGDPLAREMRIRLRREGFSGDYPCVYSAERPVGGVIPPESAPAGTLRKTVCGTAAPVVAAFGMALASVALRLLLDLPAESR